MVTDVGPAFLPDVLWEAHYLASYDITDMMCQMQMLPERADRLGGSYLRSLARSGLREHNMGPVERFDHLHRA